MSSNRFMLDASMLLTRSGLELLQEDEEVRRGAVVSAAFAEAVRQRRDGVLLPFLEPTDTEALPYALDVLPSLLPELETFSHRSVRRLPRRAGVVRARLLSGGELEAELLADEFVYLISQSLLLAKTRRILDELARAGVRVREYVSARGERLTYEMIAAVIPEKEIPKQLTPAVITKAGIKWIIAGGAATGMIIWTGEVASGLAGLVLPPFVKAIDP